jgi:hypothetical protein
LSGLSTNLGLINSAHTWGFAITIIVTAWLSKFVGAGIGARICGFSWRESAVIGELMSCKGYVFLSSFPLVYNYGLHFVIQRLIELIVLNVGLQAGMFSVLVFSMFVLEALVLTFITTPAAAFLYPPHKRKRVAEHPIGTDEEAVHGEMGERGSRIYATREHIGEEAEEDQGKGRWSNVTVILSGREYFQDDSRTSWWFCSEYR